MSEKKMVKKTIENRKHSSFMQAYPDLQYIKDAGFEVELTAIEPEPGGYGANIGDYWNIHIFKWIPKIVISKEVMDRLKEISEERGTDFDAGLEILEVEDEPKPFASGGYINAKALTELRADEQVINSEKIKEEALSEYGKEVEKQIANLARETYEKLYKEERDAFIESIKPKEYKHGGVIASEVEDEPIPGPGMSLEELIEESTERIIGKIEDVNKSEEIHLDDTRMAKVAGFHKKGEAIDPSGLWGAMLDLKNFTEKFKSKSEENSDEPELSEEELKTREIKRMSEYANELFKYIERRNANDSDRAEEIRVLEHYVRVELEEAQNPKGESVKCTDSSRIEGPCSDEPEDVESNEEVKKIAEEVFEKKFKEKQRIEEINRLIASGWKND